MREGRKGRGINRKVTCCWRYQPEDTSSLGAVRCVQGAQAAIDFWQVLLTRFFSHFLGDLFSRNLFLSAFLRKRKFLYVSVSSAIVGAIFRRTYSLSSIKFSTLVAFSNPKYVLRQ